MLASRSGWRMIAPEEKHIVRLEEPAVDAWFRANYYHVRGAVADLVIDTGTGIVPLLADLDVEPGKPVIAVATHIHVDHVGGLHEFGARLGHASEAAAFAAMPDEETRAQNFRNRLERLGYPPLPGWSPDRFRLIEAPLTRELQDGDLIDLGDRKFRVRHLPGHSPGSIALHDAGNGVLFTGDVIYDGQLVDDLPHSCRRDYVASMKALLELGDVERVYPGHNRPITAMRMRELARRYLNETQG